MQNFSKTVVLIFLLIFSISFYASANDGWAFIKENNFQAAKKAFEAQFQKNNKDIQALYGLIFISETIRDGRSYSKYVNELIEGAWNEEDYRLFDQVYNGKVETILAQKLSEQAKLKPYFYVADSLFTYRKKEEYKEILRNVIGDYDWSVIGPFKNIAGSGHIHSNEIETELFSADKTYLNDYNMPLKWFNRSLHPLNGIVSLNEGLMSSGSSMYYANTFLKIPSDRTLQFRLIRSEPIKMWLDDVLIYDSNEPSVFEWDTDIVELAVKAGTHRLLIKLSNYPKSYGRGGALSLSFEDKNQPYIYRYYESYENSYMDYDEGETYYDDEYTDVYYANGNGGPRFGLRLTNLKGKHYQDITSSFSGAYTAGKYEKIRVVKKEIITYYQTKIKENPADWANYYLLAKAFLKYELYEEGEEYFALLLKDSPGLKDKVFFKYLAAKLYTVTDKTDRAEALLSDVSEEKTPIYELVYREFKKLDKEKDEDKYLAGLKKLHKLSPTNWQIINLLISFYDDKGKKEEKKAFIESVIAAYPSFKKTLEYRLEDDSYKPFSYKTSTDKDRKKYIKRIEKLTKTVFQPSHYTSLIRYYRDKDKTEKVLALYDELIAVLPYDLNFQKQKANYLFEKDRLEEAILILNKLLPFSPYNKDVYETIGDIYLEKKDEKQALSNYEKAQNIVKATSSNSRWGSRVYSSSDLEKKIAKIKGEEKNTTKEYFKAITFEEALKDEGWKAQYGNEESVVLLHTVDMFLMEDNNFDVSQKMMIKILNEAGVKAWTEANFSFMGQVSSIKVIKTDGREISPERNYGYTVFKNLEAGDLIQVEGNYQYNMSHHEITNEVFFLAGLSQEAPIYFQKLEIVMKKEKALNIVCNRLDCNNFVDTEKNDYKIKTIERKFIPKMEMEEAVLDQLDVTSWIMISSMKDWSKIAEWYVDKTYRKLELNYEIKAAVDTLITADMTEQEKVIRLYNFVTTGIKYSYVPFLQSNFIPKDPAATFSAGIGDCKDVASLMISMLRYVGIESEYVLVKTRNFTAKEPVPSITFDHVIVGYVLTGEKTMRYIDLTTDYYPYYVIHEGDSDAWALKIKKGEQNIFRLPNNHLDAGLNTLKIDATVQLNLDKTVKIAVKTNANGLVGGRIREEVNDIPEAEQEKYILRFFGEDVFDNLTIDTFDFGNLKEITEPLLSDFQLKGANFLDKVSNLFIFQLPLLKSVSSKKALSPSKRYNALDLSQLFDITPAVQTVKVNVPNHYAITELPEAVSLDNPYFSYQLSFEKAGEGMILNRSMIFKTRLVQPEDYLDFKKYYLQVLEADNMKMYIVKQ